MSKKWNLGKILEADKEATRLPEEEKKRRIAAILAAAETKSTKPTENSQ